jgi:hypothetical protein
MDELAVGDHVVMMDHPMMGKHDRADHVGTVVAFDGDVVLVQWSGPDAPDKPSRYTPKVLERWDG